MISSKLTREETLAFALVIMSTLQLDQQKIPQVKNRLISGSFLKTCCLFSPGSQQSLKRASFLQDLQWKLDRNDREMAWYKRSETGIENERQPEMPCWSYAKRGCYKRLTWTHVAMVVRTAHAYTLDCIAMKRLKCFYIIFSWGLITCLIKHSRY